MTGPRLPPGAGMRVLLRAVMANTDTERATLLEQVCPSLPPGLVLPILQSCREDHDQHHGYNVSRALHELLDMQAALDRQESN